MNTTASSSAEGEEQSLDQSLGNSQVKDAVNGEKDLENNLSLESLKDKGGGREDKKENSKDHQLTYSGVKDISEGNEDMADEKILVTSPKPTTVLSADEETRSSPPHELSDSPSEEKYEPNQGVTFVKHSIFQQAVTPENNAKTFPHIVDSVLNSPSFEGDADSEAGTSSSSITSADPTTISHVAHVNATPQRSLLKRRSETTSEDCSSPKKRRSINFDGVTVYYFPRAQGFTCVPSQGGSTLGMGLQHTCTRKFSLLEHAAEQRKLHKQTLVRLRQQQQQNQLLHQQSEDSLAGDEDGSTIALQQNSHHSSDDSDSHDEESDSDLEMDLDNYYFLQPVPTRQRRVLLREAGIKKIDSLEKEECRDIRTSREFCGCSCKSYCDPDSCSCAQAGIKCQVDRLNFPCGCSRDGCANQTGRIEFNPIRVRTHFIHTLMRIELEKKQCEQGTTNIHLGNSLLPSNAHLPNSHQQQQQQASINCLGVLNSISDLTSSYSQSPASLQHQQKPHYLFQQHWNDPATQHQIHHLQQQQQQTPDSNDPQYKYSRSMLRDISFSSTMELESCVNAGNYTNVHCEPPLNMATPILNSSLNVTSSHPLFHRGDELSGRENSLDLYSTFRDDSYSETSDDFSNESGDNRFPPSVTVTGDQINSHHSNLEMNLLVQNGVSGVGAVNQNAIMDSTVPVSGRPSHRNNQYADAAYYSHSHASGHSIQHHQHSHQQAPYHQNMIVHSFSHRQSLPQQSYHHSHSHPNSAPIYNNNATNHVYTTDAPELHTLPHLHNDVHHSYNTNVAQPMYPKTEYTNGYTSLGEFSNGYTADHQHQPDHEHNGNSPLILSFNNVSLPEEVPTENGCSQTQLVGTGTAKNVPAYTDLNTVTSYTKLESFTEILHGAAIGACKSSFQTLQQINRDDEDVENKVTEYEPEIHSLTEDGIVENFGEIIKKSMVETVSA